jgi:hypothetical protein
MVYKVIMMMKERSDVDIFKAIKSCREVFLEVVMPSSCIFVKVSKKDLLAQIQGNMSFNGAELQIMTQYGRDALYLTTYSEKNS